jgi:hypothetical protein
VRRETQNNVSDDRLDELLAEARWPEPTPESTDRLRRQWTTLRGPRPLRYTWAAAAAVLIVIGSAAWLHLRPQRVEITAPLAVATAEINVEATPTTPIRIASRDATLHERLALLSTSPPPQPRPAPPRPAQPRPAPQKVVTAEAPHAHQESVSTLVTTARTAKSNEARAEALRALLARGDEQGTEAFLSLVLDPATRNSAMAALHDAPEPAAAALLAALDHNRVDYRLAAAKSLGSMCDHGGVGARLQQMVRDNDNRREALAALASCHGKPAADFLRAARFRPVIESELRAVQSELAGIFAEANSFHRRT